MKVETACCAPDWSEDTFSFVVTPVAVVAVRLRVTPVRRPVTTLLALLNEAHRVLEPGGLLILETPNCGNLLVASTNFHLDPTHRHPLPPLLLSFSLEQAGFGGIQTRLLHPYGPEYPVADSSPLAARFNEFLYGPQDYAVLATNA